MLDGDDHAGATDAAARGVGAVWGNGDAKLGLRASAGPLSSVGPSSCLSVIVTRRFALSASAHHGPALVHCSIGATVARSMVTLVTAGSVAEPNWADWGLRMSMGRSSPQRHREENGRV
ncbi:MAG: hypothetical protein QM783_19445 [Phycisphaerales bacterium]